MSCVPEEDETSSIELLDVALLELEDANVTSRLETLVSSTSTHKTLDEALAGIANLISPLASLI